ncbi:ubiquitin-like-conjugating enzyme ATG10 isoform X3 [Ornithodoros turicata]
MLEWDEFQRCAKEIELLSASIDDGWHFVEEKDKPGYLEKRTVFRDPQNHELVIKGLYHVVYSLSYEVPVLYFNMWRQDGSLVPLNEVWAISGTEQSDWWSTITQQEHPILHTPFFQLHPCKTQDLMKQLRSQGGHGNYLVTWLSMVGPMAALTVPTEYAKLS